MLKPAILYKEELERKFAEYLYTEDYFYYSGYSCCELPHLDLADGWYKYAIVSGTKLIGYFSYHVNYYADSVNNFGLFSFDRGNPIIGRDVFAEMERLIQQHHRVEWSMIKGNPVEKHYDKLCEKHYGNKVRFHNVCKDDQGNYHDCVTYEILKDSIFVER